MQKKADEIIRSPNFVEYSMESKIQRHYTHPDATRALIDYVQSQYGAVPERVETMEAIRIDPGGSVFSNEASPPIRIFVDGINVEIKLEHMESAIGMIMQRKPLTTDPKFSKIYMAYGIAVLPEESFEKIIEGIYEKSKEALEARQKMKDVYRDSEYLYSPEPEGDIEASIIFENLIKLADSLDAGKYDDEADAIDGIITSFAQANAWCAKQGYCARGGKLYYRTWPPMKTDLIWEPGMMVPGPLQTILKNFGLLPSSLESTPTKR